MKPVLYTPLRVEHAALRGAARSMRLVRTGMGPQRATAAARSVALTDRAPVLVAGVGGGLAPQVRPGDVVVASEVWGDGSAGTAACRRVEVPSAPLLAEALRLLGLTVHVGPIVSSPRILRGIARSHAAAAAGGALAVDMESAALVPAGKLPGATTDVTTDVTTDAIANVTGGTPFAVVRTIVDSVDHPLWRVGTLRRGVRALRTLRACLPALEWWAAAMQGRFKIVEHPGLLCRCAAGGGC